MSEAGRRNRRDPSDPSGPRDAPASSRPRDAPASSRPRDAPATRKRILNAARAVFAEQGFAGARVDAIAERAAVNKRMLYHYFGSKEDLFRVVLQETYLGIRRAEQELGLETMPPAEALDALVAFTWRYYLDNPEFVPLVANENLNEARHLRTLPRVRETAPPFVALVQSILDRGVGEGVFRPGVDAVQLNLTIAAIGFFYLTNHHTAAVIYDRDLMAEDALAARLDFNLETIRRLVRA